MNEELFEALRVEQESRFVDVARSLNWRVMGVILFVLVSMTISVQKW